MSHVHMNYGHVNDTLTLAINAGIDHSSIDCMIGIYIAQDSG